MKATNDHSLRIANVAKDVKTAILDKAEREGISYSSLLKPELRTLAEKYRSEPAAKKKD